MKEDEEKEDEEDEEKEDEEKENKEKEDENPNAGSTVTNRFIPLFCYSVTSQCNRLTNNGITPLHFG